MHGPRGLEDVFPQGQLSSTFAYGPAVLEYPARVTCRGTTGL